MAEKLPPLTSYTCDRCGRRLRQGYVYSRFTKSRYCAELDACEKRAKKSKA
jgi:hypothetical protein